MYRRPGCVLLAGYIITNAEQSTVKNSNIGLVLN